jgi:outer membrane protein OmpA-like peptidoglycan-associated protein
VVSQPKPTPKPTPNRADLALAHTGDADTDGADLEWIVELDLRIEALRKRIRQNATGGRAPAVTDPALSGDLPLPGPDERPLPHPEGADAVTPRSPTPGPVGEAPSPLLLPTPSPEPTRRTTMPRPVAGGAISRPVALAAVVVAAVAALGIGAFLGVQRGDADTVASPTPTPTTVAMSPDPAPVVASPVAAPTDLSEPAGGDEAATPPRDRGELLADAADALAVGGFPGMRLGFRDGTLEITGVLPAADLDAGYFARTASIEALVAGIDGVDSVRSRLYLRGDEAQLRRRLTAIVEGGELEFATGSADLSVAAVAAVEAAASVIKEHPGVRAVVAGHADLRGGAGANAALAARRAQTVVAELARLGVPVTRLQAVTYGELFADGDLIEAASRRVEFEVAA